MSSEILSLAIETRKITAGLRGAASEAGKFSQAFKAQMNKVSQAATMAGLKLSAIALPVGLFLKDSISIAAAMEEAGSKFDMVFSGVKKGADDAFQNLTKNFDISELAAKRMLSSTADLLTGFGFTQKEALKLSARTQELAADLVSLSGHEGGVEGASMALTKAMLGETESAKMLGVSITQTSDQYKRIRAEVAKNTSLTEMQIKAETALRVAVEQSVNAIGNYAATRGELKNLMRAYMQSVIDLKLEVGKLFIEELNIVGVFKTLQRGVKALRQWFATLDPTIRKIVVGFSLLLVTAGPLLLGLAVMSAGLGALAGMFGFLLSPIGLVVGALAGLAVAGVAMWSDIKPALMAVIEIAEGPMIQAWESFKSAVMPILEDFVAFWADVIQPVLGPVLKWIVKAVGLAGISIANSIQQVLLVFNTVKLAVVAVAEVIANVMANAGQAWDMVWGAISGVVKSQVAFILSGVAKIVDALSWLAEKLGGDTSGLDAFGERVKAMQKEIKESAVESFEDGINAAKDLWEKTDFSGTKDAFGDVKDNVKNIIDNYKSMWDVITGKAPIKKPVKRPRKGYEKEKDKKGDPAENQVMREQAAAELRIIGAMGGQNLSEVFGGHQKATEEKQLKVQEQMEKHLRALKNRPANTNKAVFA